MHPISETIVFSAIFVSMMSILKLQGRHSIVYHVQLCMAIRIFLNTAKPLKLHVYFMLKKHILSRTLALLLILKCCVDLN